MTSPSLRSHRTTAPITTRAIKPVKVDRSAKSRIRLRRFFVASTLVGAFVSNSAIGFCQTGGWSPKPFHPSPSMRPLSESPSQPINHLRTSTATPTSTALRWKSSGVDASSHSSTSANQFSSATHGLENQPAAATSSVRSLGSRDIFAENYGNPPSNPSIAGQSNEKSASPATATFTGREHIVRRTPQVFDGEYQAETANIRSMANSPYQANDEAEVADAGGTFYREPSAQLADRDFSRTRMAAASTENEARFATHEEMPRNALREGVTPAQWTSRDAISEQELNGRSVLQRTQPESLIEPPSSIQLTPPAEIPPNPFPPRLERESSELLPTEAPSADRESPSDLELPPNLRSRSDNERGVIPPQPEGSKPPTVACDEVRDRAATANISAIDLDVAPKFAVGAREKVDSEAKQREFANTAESRNWYDPNGALVAQGRLVDYANNSIVIEDATGSRTSLELRRLSDADAVYVYEAWSVPVTCSLGMRTTQPRLYEGTTVAYKASGLCHKPLYFEEIQLERSGHEYGAVVQPALSTVHFFKNIAFLPYKMGIHPITECQYPLGHYRPGNCAPWSIEPVPLSLKGFASQAKVVTGAALMLP